ncbi:DEAD/DEAH box helicase [Varibaculum prostatecancerukia]|uniref:DEAD/DEAH box helicase n=1 Tax=Varibaculum prostatecancerukia TaxID=2811781 RepID=UPI001C005F84|nr:SNF2-related protein [Varibaculum prostatecancerukia]
MSSNAPEPAWRRLISAMFTSPHPEITPGADLGICIELDGSFHPLRREVSGTWTRNRASWRDLCQTKWESVSAGLDRAQLSHLRQVAGLLEKAPQRLSSEEAAQVSPTIRSLARAGFSFALGTEPLTPLRFSPILARPFLDICAPGDVALRFGIDFSAGKDPAQRTVAATCVAAGLELVASEQLGCFALWDDRFGALNRVLGAKPVRVPQADLPDFLLQDFPRLAESFPVYSLDDSFEFPKYRYLLEVGTSRAEDLYRIHLRAMRELGGEKIETSALPVQIAELKTQVTKWLRCQEGVFTFDSFLSCPAHRINQLLDELETVFEAQDLEVNRHGIPRSFSQRGGEIIVDLAPNTYGWFTPKVRLHLDDRDFGALEIAKIRERGGLIDADTYLSEADLDRLTLLIERAGLNRRGIHPAIIDLSQILEGTQAQVRGLEAWKSRQLKLPPIAPPHTAKLREYQRTGVSWLLAQLAIGPGAVLADEMGLGKTLQILAAIKSLPTSSPVLVVAPTSVINVWESQAQRFYPEMEVRALRSGSDIEDGFSGADLVVTSYGLLRRHSETFLQPQWQGVICDEAQLVKNPRTQAWRVLNDLDRKWTICATGTPLENSLADLHAILSLAQPGTLLSREQFSALQLRGLTQVRSLVAPYMLRRTKAEVAPDLPPKIEQVLRVDLEPGHIATYRELEAQARHQVSGLLRSGDRMSILAALTALRRASLDLRLVGGRAGITSAKTNALVEQLQAIPGHKALVFSQFTSYLKLIKEALEGAGIITAYLDGSTRQRDQVVKEFSEGDAQAFLISLRAGGTGLTLTAADYVFVMDPWWNPAVEEQAIDRAHRIGQDRPVNVYRLVAKGTIEEKVSQLQQRKRDLFTSIVKSSGSMAELASSLLMENNDTN